MLRVDPVCNLRLTFMFADQGYARCSINGFSAGPMNGNAMTFTIPVEHWTALPNGTGLDPPCAHSGFRSATLGGPMFREAGSVPEDMVDDDPECEQLS